MLQCNELEWNNNDQPHNTMPYKKVVLLYIGYHFYIYHNYHKLVILLATKCYITIIFEPTRQKNGMVKNAVTP